MGSGLLSGPSPSILGLDASIHRHQQHHLTHQQLPHQHHMHAMAALSVDHHNNTGMEGDQSFSILEPKNPSKNLGIGTRVKNTSNTSDEDEPSYNEDGTDGQFIGAKGKKGSPWQRMKWSDHMVRLLITVVSYVGEDGTPDGESGHKRKGGILQKKGKWKTVSKIMMEKGCSVSPQQCEDKFNDLNKRYKRLNDILGRGTTCRVVENPSLLDSMNHLSAKTKDDVRKILSSKHLFYKEMCAYHNGQRISNVHEVHPLMLCKSRETQDGCDFVKDDNGFGGDEDEDEENDDDELDNDDDDDDDGDDDDGNVGDGDGERMVSLGKRKKVNENEGCFWPQGIVSECGKTGVAENFGVEMAGMLPDNAKSPWEQRELIKSRVLQLQEQRVGLQAQAFELEKRRFRWQKFCSKKDRELERLKLENERMRLDNERMSLQMRQKELDME
ncbi:hypothetical protein AMTR_s00022p00244920 [Amborella trichopoda]|uniref:Myb/SANT-like DNA-binding domain-containing protein n=2 Tax=Amborella trichopoda TaxID=13333 RepID=W1PVN8_AMBTC|nr:hypothetical protein AMTR_s00022p00244920 [Amborella trichopoda]